MIVSLFYMPKVTSHQEVMRKARLTNMVILMVAMLNQVQCFVFFCRVGGKQFKCVKSYFTLQDVILSKSTTENLIIYT